MLLQNCLRYFNLGPQRCICGFFKVYPELKVAFCLLFIKGVGYPPKAHQKIIVISIHVKLFCIKIKLGRDILIYFLCFFCFRLLDRHDWRAGTGHRGADSRR